MPRLCDDCGNPSGEDRAYWTGRDSWDVLCAECAGPYLCPDNHEDETPEHWAACVSPDKEGFGS